MNNTVARLLVAFGTGLLFAIGLGLGGMLHPAKVVGFLDVGGRWDPSLAFVMGAGVMANLLFVRLALKRSHPLLDTKFQLPTLTKIDAKLLVGSALFGIGWGLGGYCPGPGLVSATTLSGDALLFVLVMTLGIAGTRWFEASRGR
ncbi:MAG: DUF6691 family protein [Myxococcota bacterium]